MTFTELSPYVQNIYLVEYNQQVKVIVLFGFFLLALFYKYYLYEHQQPTSILLVGTIRAVLYGASYLYSWIFWLLMPVMYHPAVGIDHILLFLSYAFSGIFTIATVVFLLNTTMFVPKYFVNFGKIDIKNVESEAIKKYFTKFKMK